MISSYAAIIINFKYKTMYKKCKLVMLTSNEKAPIFSIRSWKKLYNSNMVKAINPITFNDDESYQHLYIISDEEIKEGDWCIINDSIRIGKYDGNINKNWYKKIISSTDSNLNLPQPSQSFIDKYIEEYNKGNIITDVMVEYDTTLGDKEDENQNLIPINIIKVNSKDNTITIKKVKDSWNKDEVNALIRRFENELCAKFKHDSIPYANVDDRVKFINDYLNNI
jgi:hypothetical protein